jgi:hypothetical protein
MSDDETKVPVAPESRMTGNGGRMEDDGVCGTKTDNERGNGAFRLLLSVTVVPPRQTGSQKQF